MEKRASNRVSAHLYTRFFYGNVSYTGIVTDLSKNGMYIKTGKCLPFQSKSVVLIPLIEEVLKIPGHITRVTRKDNKCKGIAVGLSNPPENYLSLIDSLKSVS